MIQPKYNAQESLQRAKLLMGYDTSKTLTENIKSNPILKEAAAANPNVVTDQDLMGNTSMIRGALQSISDFSGLIGLPNVWDIVGVNWGNLIGGKRTGVKGVVDALDGWVDAADLGYVLSIIKSLDGKCYFDPIEEKSVSATQRFLELYSEDESGEDLKSEVESVGTRTLPTGSEKLKQLIIKTIDKQVAAGCKASTGGGGTAPGNSRQQNINNIYCSVKNGVIVSPQSAMNGTKWADYVSKFKVTPEEIEAAKKSCSGGGGGTGDGKKKTGGGSSYKPCSGKYTRGCKSDVIKQVQACLGMAAKHQTGNFGPLTQAKLAEVGKSYSSGFSDADVATICNKQPAQPAKPAGTEDLEVDNKLNEPK